MKFIFFNNCFLFLSNTVNRFNGISNGITIGWMKGCNFRGFRTFRDDFVWQFNVEGQN